jgi:hypothetical protein
MKALQNYAFYPLWACTGYLAGYSLLLAAGVV